MIIYQITLPREHDAEKFVKFMREEYFPAVHKGSTRMGQVTSLLLLGPKHKARTKGWEYLLQVGWGGLPTDQIRLDNEKVTSKLKSFEARFKFLGFYTDAVAWPKGEKAA